MEGNDDQIFHMHAVIDELKAELEKVEGQKREGTEKLGFVKKNLYHLEAKYCLLKNKLGPERDAATAVCTSTGLWMRLDALTVF